MATTNEQNPTLSGDDLTIAALQKGTVKWPVFDLFHTIEEGNIDLLRKVFNLNLSYIQDLLSEISGHHNGRTPLNAAAHKGHTEIVKLLLAQTNINIRLKDRNQEDALMVAIRAGHIEIARILFQKIKSLPFSNRKGLFDKDPSGARKSVPEYAEDYDSLHSRKEMTNLVKRYAEVTFYQDLDPMNPVEKKATQEGLQQPQTPQQDAHATPKETTSNEDPIFMAIKKGDTKAVSEFVCSKQNLGVLDANDCSLSIAAMVALANNPSSEQHKNNTDSLIVADPNLPPLFKAVFQGDLKQVREILEKLPPEERENPQVFKGSITLFDMLLFSAFLEHTPHRENLKTVARFLIDNHLGNNIVDSYQFKVDAGFSTGGASLGNPASVISKAWLSANSGVATPSKLAAKIIDNDMVYVIAYLKSGLPIDTVDQQARDKGTPLMELLPFVAAAERDDYPLCDFLMRKAGHATRALYFMAAKDGLLKTIDRLVRRDHMLNQQDEAGMTAVLFAAQQGHNHVLKHLEQHFCTSINLAHKNKKGMNVLMLACQHWQPRTVSLLLEMNIRLLPTQRFNINEICEPEHATAFEFCVAKNKDYAFASGLMGSLFKLRGFKKHQIGVRNLVHEAISHKKSGLLQWLLDNQYLEDVNQLISRFFMEDPSGGMTPLHHAAHMGDVEGFNILIGNGANLFKCVTIEDIPRTAIFYVCYLGHHQLLKSILENHLHRKENLEPENLQKLSEAFRDGLNMAIRKDQSAIVSLLMENDILFSMGILRREDLCNILFNPKVKFSRLVFKSILKRALLCNLEGSESEKIKRLIYSKIIEEHKAIATIISAFAEVISALKQEEGDEKPQADASILIPLEALKNYPDFYKKIQEKLQNSAYRKILSQKLQNQDGKLYLVLSKERLFSVFNNLAERHLHDSENWDTVIPEMIFSTTPEVMEAEELFERNETLEKKLQECLRLIQEVQTWQERNLSNEIKVDNDTLKTLITEIEGYHKEMNDALANEASIENVNSGKKNRRAKLKIKPSELTVKRVAKIKREYEQLVKELEDLVASLNKKLEQQFQEDFFQLCRNTDPETVENKLKGLRQDVVDLHRKHAELKEWVRELRECRSAIQEKLGKKETAEENAKEEQKRLDETEQEFRRRKVQAFQEKRDQDAIARVDAAAKEAARAKQKEIFLAQSAAAATEWLERQLAQQRDAKLRRQEREIKGELDDVHASRTANGSPTPARPGRKSPPRPSDIILGDQMRIDQRAKLEKELDPLEVVLKEIAENQFKVQGELSIPQLRMQRAAMRGALARMFEIIRNMPGIKQDNHDLAEELRVYLFKAPLKIPAFSLDSEKEFDHESNIIFNEYLRAKLSIIAKFIRNEIGKNIPFAEGFDALFAAMEDDFLKNIHIEAQKFIKEKAEIWDKEFKGLSEQDKIAKEMDLLFDIERDNADIKVFKELFVAKQASEASHTLATAFHIGHRGANCAAIRDYFPKTFHHRKKTQRKEQFLKDIEAGNEVRHEVEYDQLGKDQASTSSGNAGNSGKEASGSPQTTAANAQKASVNLSNPEEFPSLVQASNSNANAQVGSPTLLYSQGTPQALGKPAAQNETTPVETKKSAESQVSQMLQTQQIQPTQQPKPKRGTKPPRVSGFREFAVHPGFNPGDYQPDERVRPVSPAPASERKDKPKAPAKKPKV